MPRLDNSGTIDPGLLPGGDTTDDLGTGTLTLNNGSTFVVELGGLDPNDPNNQHDQLDVTGTVTLNGANLNLSLSTGYTPNPTDNFTIIANDDGGDTVNGTFTVTDDVFGAINAAEGQGFTTGGNVYTITYQGADGGDNNDVILTFVGAAETLVTLDAGTLVIEDINDTTSADLLTITEGGTGAGAYYEITDTNATPLALTTDIPGAVRVDGSTIRVLKSDVTGGVRFETKGGDDIVNLGTVNGLTGDLQVDTGADGTATGDTVNVTGTFNAGAGNDILIGSTNDDVETINFDGGSISGDDVVLDATGSIIDQDSDVTANDPGTADRIDVTANTLLVEAGTGFGEAGDAVDTAVDNVEGTGGTGGVFVENVGDLTVGGVDAAVNGTSVTGGDIQVVSHGTVTIDEQIANSGTGNVEINTLSTVFVNFDGGVQGWTTAFDANSAIGNATTAGSSWALGNSLPGTTGVTLPNTWWTNPNLGPENGTERSHVTSPTFTVSSNGEVPFNFDFYSSTEGGYPSIWDVEHVQASINGGVFADLHAVDPELHNQYDQLFRNVTFMTGVLTAGDSVQFRFLYDTGDNSVTNNEIHGVAFGNVTIGNVTPGDNSDIILNTNIITNGGNVSLNGANDIIQNSGIVSTSGIGTIDLDASTATPGGVITQADGTSITADSGNITLDAEGDITVANVESTSGDVDVTTTSGNILDGGDTDTTDVGGDAVTLSAANGTIGDVAAGDEIALDATSLTTDTNLSNGNQFLSEADSVTVTGITAGTGTVEIRGGEFDLNTDDVVSDGSAITVENGATLDGDNSDTLAGVTVKSGGTFKGDGNINTDVTVESGGTISPGDSTPDLIDDLGTGNLTLNSGANFPIELGGNPANPGTDYDQLDVSGSVALNGATFTPLLTAVPNTGVFVIIDNNTAADSVGGTPAQFAGFPEGHVFDLTVNGNPTGTPYVFQISYIYNADTSTAGTGNDVVLISLGAAETSVTIDGSGNLVIEDINGATSNDNLVVDFDGTNYTITDTSGLTLTTTISDATRPLPNQVVVPANSADFAGGAIAGLTLNTLGNNGGGNDQVNFSGGSAIALNGDLTFNDAENITIDTGDSIDLNGNDVVMQGNDGLGTNTLTIAGGSLDDFASLAEDTTNDEKNNVILDFGTLDQDGDITVDNLTINPTDAGTASVTYTRTGGALVVKEDLTLGGAPNAGDQDKGNLTQNGGSVSVGGNLLFGGAANTEGGTYDLNGGTLHVMGNVIEGAAGAATSSVDTAQLYVDEPNSLTVDGSVITVQSFRVGDNQPGNYTVPAGQTLTTTGTLLVGRAAVGTLVIESTGNVAANMTVSDAAGGAGSRLTIQNAGGLTSGSIDVGDQNNSNGIIDILGDATLRANGRVDVGQVGTARGTINVTDGTFDVNAGIRLGGDGLTDSNTSGTINIGAAGGATTGTVTVAGNTEVGYGGTGTIDLNAGSFTQETANLVVAQGDNSNGTVTMAAGTTLDIDAGSLNIANSGVGVFTQNGGDLAVAVDISLGNTGGTNADGTYNLQGGTAAVTGVVIVGEDADSIGKVNIGTVGSGTPTLTVNSGFNVANNATATGEVTIGDGTNLPIITVSGGNFETAFNGDGTLIFNSGTINQNTNNFITGQNAGSTATVTIGGVGNTADATLNLNGNGVLNHGDWNTNSGQGTVSVLDNGVVNVGNDINLGSGAGSGLDLTINGGTVNLGTGTPGSGNIDYRTNGTDQINLQDGLLEGSGGFINLRDSAATSFSFTGGTLRNFDRFTNSAGTGANLTQTGATSLLDIGAENPTPNTVNPATISTMTIDGNYSVTDGTVRFDVAADGTFDQLVVNGSVTLNGATLQINVDSGLTLATAPQTIKLIDNDTAADPVNPAAGVKFVDGLGNALNQGDPVSINSELFTIFSIQRPQCRRRK